MDMTMSDLDSLSTYLIRDECNMTYFLSILKFHSVLIIIDWLQGGVLSHLEDILLASGIPADVLTEAINTISELIRGNNENQVKNEEIGE